MSIARLRTALVLAFVSVYLQAQPTPQKITMTGKLVREMAMGGESTGWTVELESTTTIDGKPVNSIQVSDRNAGEFEKLENQRVRATGQLTHRHGVETGEQLVLQVSSIKEAKAAARPASFSLAGSAWLLKDLSGGAVINNSHATLKFPEAGKIAGNGSCNQFFGSVEIHGDTIKVGPLASTRMACADQAAMHQEAKYLEALQAVERFEWKDPYLLMYCKGIDKPLRFTRIPAPAEKMTPPPLSKTFPQGTEHHFTSPHTGAARD
jgi:heat shock protein HslJ